MITHYVHVLMLRTVGCDHRGVVAIEGHDYEGYADKDGIVTISLLDGNDKAHDFVLTVGDYTVLKISGLPDEDFDAILKNDSIGGC